MSLSSRIYRFEPPIYPFTHLPNRTLRCSWFNNYFHNTWITLPLYITTPSLTLLTGVPHKCTLYTVEHMYWRYNRIMHAQYCTCKVVSISILKMCTVIIVMKMTVIKSKIIKYSAVSGPLLYNFNITSSCIVAIVSFSVNVAPRFSLSAIFCTAVEWIAKVTLMS